MPPNKFRVNWPFSSGEETKNRLNFQSEQCLAIFDLQVTPKLPAQVQVNWHFGSGEEVKNRFPRLPHGDFLGFPIGTILLFFFGLQITLIFPIKSRVNRPFCSGEVKNRFSRWRSSWISDKKKNKLFFDLQVTLIFLTTFQVHSPFGSG